MSKETKAMAIERMLDRGLDIGFIARLVGVERSYVRTVRRRMMLRQETGKPYTASELAKQRERQRCPAFRAKQAEAQRHRYQTDEAYREAERARVRARYNRNKPEVQA